MICPNAGKKPCFYRLHQETRQDDFAWLRDDQRSDPEMLAYLAQENRYTEQQMAPLSGLQAELFTEMTGRLPGNDHSVPFLKNGHWYQQRYNQGEDYPYWVWRQDRPEAEWQTLFNCNQRAQGCDYYQLGALELTYDHRFLAVTEDRQARRIYQTQIFDLHNDCWLADVIDGVSASILWANDGKTLYYIKQDEQTLLPWQVWRHQVGSDPATDHLVFEEQDERFYLSLGQTSSEDYLLIILDSTSSSEVWCLAANNPQASAHCFLPRSEDREYSLDHYLGHFYIRSNHQGYNFGLYRCQQPQQATCSWQTLIPADEQRIIEEFQLFSDWLVTEQRQQGQIALWQYRLDGTDPRQLPKLEENGVVWIGYNPQVNTTKLRYHYSSLTAPTTTYQWDLATGEQQLLKQMNIPDYHPENYQSDWRWLMMEDGCQVPVSLVWRRDCYQPGKNPLLVYGYGAYGTIIDADFSLVRQSLLDRGFIYAIVHVRGGGELGRPWYDAGRLTQKMNTFTDFIGATRQLLDQCIGDRQRCYAMGGSAGGLLIGAVSNMAPDLYHAMVAQVPFVDVLTTMLDETIPLTTGEYEEWGNPNHAADYHTMRQYSPYDNVAAQDYPHLLVTTGLHDSQVQYWEPAKWVAKLRSIKTDSHQLLLHTDMGAGHGGKSGRYQAFHDVALEWSFLIGLASGQWPKT